MKRGRQTKEPKEKRKDERKENDETRSERVGRQWKEEKGGGEGRR